MPRQRICLKAAVKFRRHVVRLVRSKFNKNVQNLSVFGRCFETELAKRFARYLVGPVF